MIETTEQTICKDCGTPLLQAERQGPHKREFCNATCRKRWHRKQQAHAPLKNATIATMEAQQRIAELEQEVQHLQEQLNIEQRFRTDTRTWNFRRWIRQHQYTHWKDIDFFQRFLDDRRLHVDPRTDQLFTEMPKSLYLHRLHQYGYSEEEIALFKEAWIDMLFMEK